MAVAAEAQAARHDLQTAARQMRSGISSAVKTVTSRSRWSEGISTSIVDGVQDVVFFL